MARIRFTPTRVGTTLPLRNGLPTSTVHPHACGDNASVAVSKSTDPGSPPRVWGQLLMFAGLLIGLRFTPTRVGTTSAARLSLRPVTVHPHACGDNVLLWLAPILGARFTPTRVGTTLLAYLPVEPTGGSPPRVWGQLSERGIALFPQRFTPTRVGTTPAGASGLPDGDRFTPTRVGTTKRVNCNRFSITVHPHACGDNSRVHPGARYTTGSPPRVWGQPGL